MRRNVISFFIYNLGSFLPKDACKSDRSHQELFLKLDPNSNEYLVANFGFDTAENESSKACQKAVRQ